MGSFLDAEAILDRKQAKQRQQQECIEWAVGALGEFPDAFRTVGGTWTGARSRIYGILELVSNNVEAGSGADNPAFGDWAWFLPVIPVNDKEKAIDNKVWGLAWGADGQWYWQGKPRDIDGAASVIAEACDYRIDVARRALEAALLGEPMSVRETLNAE